ncbi:MAG: T9SS type A sorting domain-containing protein [Bacteroidales bacterium]
MKTKLHILLSLLLLPALLPAQPGNEKRAYHWYFGHNAGLDFSSGTIQEDTQGQVFAFEGSASISDTAGNLLFYAGPNGGTEPGENNMTVYNANHEVMQNGYDIDCGWDGRQNSIIVPLPESDSIYYLLTIGHYCNQYTNQLGLKLNIVDMSLDGGLGAVTDKNIEIYPSSYNDTLSEILTAVHHGNCRDVWVMIHRFNADKFLAYKINENGLDDEPVVNNIGYTGENCMGWGAKFSPNGKYFVVNKSYNIHQNGILKNDTLELYKFDNETGVLSDRIALPMDSALFGKEFSPDCHYLYTFEAHYYFLGLYQYDISKWQKPYILNSKTLVASLFTIAPDLQLTPLNNIIISGDCDTISVIEQPNNQGTSCSVNTNVITLFNESKTKMPNFICSYFNDDTSAYNCDTSTYKKSFSSVNLSIYPNPVQNKAIINTNGKAITQFSLFDITGKKIDNNQYLLKKNSNGKYMFNNLKLKGGMYLLSGVFADKGQFNIKIIINN